MAVAIKPGRRHHECKAGVFYPLTSFGRFGGHSTNHRTKRHRLFLPPCFLPPCSPTLPRFYPLLGWRSKFGSLPHVLRHSYEHPKTVSPNEVGIVPLSTNPHFLSCSFPAYLKASVCTLWSCNISVTGSFSASVAQNANLDDARPALILVKGEGA